jgi:hypothetical protein
VQCGQRADSGPVQPGLPQYLPVKHGARESPPVQPVERRYAPSPCSPSPNRKATSYNRYGSATHKQLYIYGGLDTSPTELVRSFGLAWGMGGWLVTPFLQKLEPAKVAALRQRIAAELTTTFASAHTEQVSLAGSSAAERRARLCEEGDRGEVIDHAGVSGSAIIAWHAVDRAGLRGDVGGLRGAHSGAFRQLGAGAGRYSSDREPRRSCGATRG